MRNAPGERLKVVLAESGRSVGGTERVVWELATRLSPQRFDVRVWLSPVKELDEFAAALEARGIGVDRLAEVDSRWDWRGMLDTWMRLRKARPAVLHVHHVWPAADRYLCMLARAAGVPNDPRFAQQWQRGRKRPPPPSRRHEGLWRRPGKPRGVFQRV